MAMRDVGLNSVLGAECRFCPFFTWFIISEMTEKCAYLLFLIWVAFLTVCGPFVNSLSAHEAKQEPRKFEAQVKLCSDWELKLSAITRKESMIASDKRKTANYYLKKN
ncbi:hypothetical protein HS088_TW08G00401 [Tripterygium wilfordii]|uniref:Uncharacterized protein n=1 Tax=Tripterygium wilfordii TaxID=458696 RepID=A0A7J7DBU6_TRIWF|nr:hypothetical protein HS088_TW08G00401 [Tripterygium wilfordii]